LLVWSKTSLEVAAMTATCSKRARAPGRTLAVTHSEEASDSNDPEWFLEASPRAAK